MNTITIPAEVRCVATALALLPDSTLRSASAALNTVIQTLTAYEAILAARLSSLNLILLPLLAKKAAIENIIKSYQTTTNLFAQGVVNQCPALGATVQIAQSAIDPYIAGARRLLNIINITARLQLEYGKYRDEIIKQINFLRRVKAQIDNLIQIRTSVIMTASIKPSIKGL
jgi:hypothetical protein